MRCSFWLKELEGDNKMFIPFFNTYLNFQKHLAVLAVMLFFIMSSQASFGQRITEDTTATGDKASTSDSVAVLVKKKGLSSPKRAMLLSMACPGLGQAYNKKYWKLPILYAGVTLLAYFWITNQQGYSEMKGAAEAYQNSYDPSSPTLPVFQSFTSKNDGFTYTSISQVKIARDDYRSNRDLSVVLSITLYAVQILDAYVDAHLKEFDVSKDLSLKITPLIYQNNNANFGNYNITTGVNLCFTLK